MGVRLPAEYQEVEYIKGINNTTYINTGVKPASDISIFGVFSFRNSICSTLFGARSSAGWWFVSMSDATAPATPAFWYNSTLIRAQLPYNDDGDWFQITMSNTNGSIFDADGVLLLSKDFNAVDFPDLDMYLFVRNQNDTPVGSGTVGCKRFVIYKSSATVRDFIPCYRKADNEPGMYDLVTKQFFVNQGTGEFIVGPDVIDSISPLMVAWRRGLMMQRKHTITIPLLYSRGLTTSYNTYYGNAKRACSTHDILVMAGETIKITKPSSVDIGIYTWDENTKQVVFVGAWNESLSAYTPSTNEFYRITIRTNPEHDINNGEVSNIITAVKGTQKYIFV